MFSSTYSWVYILWLNEEEKSGAQGLIIVSVTSKLVRERHHGFNQKRDIYGLIPLAKKVDFTKSSFGPDGEARQDNRLNF